MPSLVVLPSPFYGQDINCLHSKFQTQWKVSLWIKMAFQYCSSMNNLCSQNRSNFSKGTCPQEDKLWWFLLVSLPHILLGHIALSQNTSTTYHIFQISLLTVLGRILAPKDARVLILGTCIYVTLHGKGTFIDMLYISS